MSKTRQNENYTLGRHAFAKISAVEGISLTPEMSEAFAEFDRKGLPPAERRRAIIGKYASVR